MSDWKDRLLNTVEIILEKQDPCPELSAYHDMPYAIFRYPPEDEFEARSEISMLKTRLEKLGKRVTIISLAECLQSAMEAENMSVSDLETAETSIGIEPTIETINQVLSEYQKLDDVVAARLPENSDRCKDIVFITRAGALYPAYRTSSLLEQLQGKLNVPAILFYPGELDGPSGLSFMGEMDPVHNYRPRIF